MPKSRLFLRLGSHSEKDYLLKTAKLFAGVIVGANLVESTPGATVSLASKLIGGMKLEFAIDPMTYVYGLDLSYIKSETIDRKAKIKGTKKFSLKKSFVALGNELDGIVESQVLSLGKSITPADILRGRASLELCERVLDYQLNRMRRYCASDPQLSEIADALQTPSFAFSPYFYIPDETDPKSGEWEQAVIKLIEDFGSLNSPVPKYAVLCISRRILKDQKRCIDLVGKVIASGCDGCWLWISDLREEQITGAELDNLLTVTKLFFLTGKRLFNLHGGFLSIILSKFGMEGMSHGIGYGESKDVTPVLGATVPTVNYHYPPLHVRVPILEVDVALSNLGIHDASEFHNKVCDCAICVGILKGDLNNLKQFGDFVLKIGNQRKSQTPDSAKKCRFHFLLARSNELLFVEQRTLPEIKLSLKTTWAEYSKLPTYLGLQNRSDHLAVWNEKL